MGICFIYMHVCMISRSSFRLLLLPYKWKIKKKISPSTRKRNAQRINQWKAKRNEAVGDSKTCAQTQTDDSNSITDETTQTEQLHSDEQALHKPTTLTQIRERSTQTRSNFIDRQLTPTKHLNTEESRTPWNKCTAVRSPYNRGKLTYIV